MLVGHVFPKQTFKNEIFALFMDVFLQGNMGIVQGCELLKTNDSVTIGEGVFFIKGRPLQIIGNETVVVSENGYYSLVCEIDLTKENTKEEFNQGDVKVIKGSTSYPDLTKQDLNNGGTLYQYEFARFRVTDAGITDFVDKRAFLDFTSIHEKIIKDTSKVITQIQESLDNVLDGSIYLTKTDVQKISSGIEIPTDLEDGEVYMQYFE